jgi:acetate kinase
LAHTLLLSDLPRLSSSVAESAKTESVRAYVCEGLLSSGVEIDAEANRSLIDTGGRLSTNASKIAVWVIPTEEALQIAHECCLA